MTKKLIIFLISLINLNEKSCERIDLWAFFILLLNFRNLRNVEESVCTGILEFNSRSCERMVEELSDSSPDEPPLPRPVIDGELLLFINFAVICCSSMKLNGLLLGSVVVMLLFFFFFW